MIGENVDIDALAAQWQAEGSSEPLDSEPKPAGPDYIRDDDGCGVEDEDSDPDRTKDLTGEPIHPRVPWWPAERNNEAGS